MLTTPFCVLVLIQWSVGQQNISAESVKKVSASQVLQSLIFTNLSWRQRNTFKLSPLVLGCISLVWSDFLSWADLVMPLRLETLSQERTALTCSQLSCQERRLGGSYWGPWCVLFGEGKREGMTGLESLLCWQLVWRLCFCFLPLPLLTRQICRFMFQGNLYGTGDVKCEGLSYGLFCVLVYSEVRLIVFQDLGRFF